MFNESDTQQSSTDIPVALEFPIELEFRNVSFLRREENWRTLRKTLGARARTNNRLNPHMMPGPGIEPGTHWWYKSALTTATPLLPIKFLLLTRWRTYLFSTGNSIPSGNPKAATISSGFPSDTAERRPEWTTEDFTGSGSYADNKPSSNTPSWGALNGIADRKGLPISLQLQVYTDLNVIARNGLYLKLLSNIHCRLWSWREKDYFKIFTVNKMTYLSFFSTGNSIPSGNPKAATISSGFPSDSVEHRPEGAAEDFTGFGSYANDKQSSNTPSWGALNGIADRKGLLISLELQVYTDLNVLARNGLYLKLLSNIHCRL